MDSAAQSEPPYSTVVLDKFVSAIRDIGGRREITTVLGRAWEFDVPLHRDGLEMSAQHLGRVLLAYRCILTDGDSEMPCWVPLEHVGTTAIREKAQTTWPYYASCTYRVEQRDGQRHLVVAVPANTAKFAFDVEAPCEVKVRSGSHRHFIGQAIVCAMMADTIDYSAFAEYSRDVRVFPAVELGEAIGGGQTETNAVEFKSSQPQVDTAAKTAISVRNHLSAYIKCLGSRTETSARLFAGVLDDGRAVGVAKGTAAALVKLFASKGGPVTDATAIFPPLGDLRVTVAARPVVITERARRVKWNTDPHEFVRRAAGIVDRQATAFGWVAANEPASPAFTPVGGAGTPSLNEREVVIVHIQLRAGYYLFSPRIHWSPEQRHPFTDWYAIRRAAIARAVQQAIASADKLLHLRLTRTSFPVLTMEMAEDFYAPPADDNSPHADHKQAAIARAKALFPRCTPMDECKEPFYGDVRVRFDGDDRKGSLLQLAHKLDIDPGLLAQVNTHIGDGKIAGHPVFVPTTERLLRADAASVDACDVEAVGNAIDSIRKDCPLGTTCVVFDVDEGHGADKHTAAALLAHLKKLRLDSTTVVVVGSSPQDVLSCAGTFHSWCPVQFACPESLPHVFRACNEDTVERPHCDFDPAALMEMRRHGVFHFYAASSTVPCLRREDLQQFLLGDLQNKELVAAAYASKDVPIITALLPYLRIRDSRPQERAVVLCLNRPLQRLCGFTTALNQAAVRLAKEKSGVACLDWRPPGSSKIDTSADLAKALSDFISTIPKNHFAVIVVNAVRDAPFATHIELPDKREVVVVFEVKEKGLKVPWSALLPDHSAITRVHKAFTAAFSEAETVRELGNLKDAASRDECANDRMKFHLRWLMMWAITARRRKFTPLVALVNELADAVSALAEEEATKLQFLAATNACTTDAAERLPELGGSSSWALCGVLCSDAKRFVHPYVAWCLCEKWASAAAPGQFCNAMLQAAWLRGMLRDMLVGQGVRYASNVQLSPLLLLASSADEPVDPQTALDAAKSSVDGLSEAMLAFLRLTKPLTAVADAGLAVASARIDLIAGRLALANGSLDLAARSIDAARRTLGKIDEGLPEIVARLKFQVECYAAVCARVQETSTSSEIVLNVVAARNTLRDRDWLNDQDDALDRELNGLESLEHVRNSSRFKNLPDQLSREAWADNLSFA